MHMAGRIKVVKVGQICSHWSANLECEELQGDHADEFLQSEQQHDQPRPSTVCLCVCLVTQPWRPQCSLRWQRHSEKPRCHWEHQHGNEFWWTVPQSIMSEKKWKKTTTVSVSQPLVWFYCAGTRMQLKIFSFPKPILNHATLRQCNRITLQDSVDWTRPSFAVSDEPG